jgi:hypothetical protein
MNRNSGSARALPRCRSGVEPDVKAPAADAVAAAEKPALEKIRSSKAGK